jgi:hypothetical protein
MEHDRRFNMTARVQRSMSEPIRSGLTWDECWAGDDHGLIKCWENGRLLRQRQPELGARAERGELPPLEWKGGAERPLKQKDPKYGVHYYIATWQGLRGEDLDVDSSVEVEMVCPTTGVRFIYTDDIKKYGKESDSR